MKIAITGSGGLLGGCISRSAKSHGHLVVPIHFLVANECESSDLVKACLLDIRDCDFIINCAGSKSPKKKFDFFLNTKVPKIIEDYIIDQRLRCKLIHISSINVAIDLLEDKYTQSKRQGEVLLNGLHSSIIRPGLLWAQNDDPLLLAISAYFTHPFLPKFMLKPGNTYSPINPNTLANFIINKLMDLGSETQIINVLGDRKYTLWLLMKQLAIRMNSRLIPVPTSLFKFIPWLWLIKRLNMTEIFNQMLPIDRTNLPIKNGELLVLLPFNAWEI
jgi:hypothetical protein